VQNAGEKNLGYGIGFGWVFSTYEPSLASTVLLG